MPYSFESTFLYSDLSTRFEVAESHTIFRERVPKRCMWGRGSCIFRCGLLSRDAFANLRPSLRRIEIATLASFRHASDPPFDEPSPRRPPPLGVGSELRAHHLAMIFTSPASLLPMMVASWCSHLAMSSPRCGSSSREVIWRCALPFGPSSPRNEVPLRRPHPRCTSSLWERGSSFDAPHSP